MHNTQTEQPEGSVATVVAKVKLMKKSVDNREQKPVHDKYVAYSKQAYVDQKHANQWLRSSELKKIESEIFILAAQEQSLLTWDYQINLMKIE